MLKRIGFFDSNRDAKMLVRAVERMTLERASSPHEPRLSLGGSDAELEFTRVHSKDFDDSDESFDSDSMYSPRQRTHSEPLFSSMDVEAGGDKGTLPKRVVQLRRDASRRHDEKIVSALTTKLTRRTSRRRNMTRSGEASAPRPVEMKNGYSAGCECEDDDACRVMCAFCVRAENVAG